ncbi:uncharacterized protein K441DRAFT_656464 [Cenococcum geophilum 1.58]|uniref:uncharacterized protein n=1 Tax=Cenococcum geophilum 1.58 TaxID=794803 RepID=UPI00358F0BCE|nr:hypothetical protein K441DRAFT_656464 [Cenococcum geophilum 1.58]
MASTFSVSPFGKNWLKATRNNLLKLLYGRRVFQSRSGRLGLISSYASLGDKIDIFSGGSVPYAIWSEGNTYKLIGECFPAEFMHGRRPDSAGLETILPPETRRVPVFDLCFAPQR